MLGDKEKVKKVSRTYIRWIASKMINIEIKIRNIPLAKPDNVSTRPYLNTVNCGVCRLLPNGLTHK